MRQQRSGGGIVALVAMNLLVLVVLVLAVEGLSFLALTAKSWIAPGENSADRGVFKEHAFRNGRAEAVAYATAEASQGHSLRTLLVTPTDQASPALNVSGGVRQSCCAAPGAPAWWMFGGSTTFGLMVDDAHTIASLMNRHQDKPRYGVVNHGIIAMDRSQELINLMLRLSDGERPAGVIIYDGVNDLEHAFTAGPGKPYDAAHQEALLGARPAAVTYELFRRTNTGKVVMSVVSRLRRGSAAAAATANSAATPDEIALAKGACKVYTARLQTLRRLAKAYDIPILFVLQPALISGIEIEAGVATPFEQQIYQGQNPSFRRVAREFFRLAARDPRQVDLTRLFVERRQAGEYYDEVHLGPDGNDTVARALLATLDEDLRSGPLADREPPADLCER